MGQLGAFKLVADAHVEDRASRRFQVRGLRCVGGGTGVLGRLAAAVGVRCRVIDFSTRGARVVCPIGWAEGTEGILLLSSGRVRVRLRARCVWSRREGFCRHLCGLAFENVGESDARTLALLADRHGVPSVLARVA